MPIADFRTRLERYVDDKHFKRLEVGAFSLSIQASATHYSRPRADGLKPEEYSAFEVAFFEDDKWVREPWNDKRFADVTSRDDWSAADKTCVAPFLAAEKVQRLWERINELGLKSMN